MDFHPRNILIIDFGQLGDVVLSLPALRAVRERFPHARITVAAGTPAHEIVRLSEYANEVIPVDRVKMKYGNKLAAGYKIIKLVQDLRSRRFDFVIDLHSLPETNMLMWVTGARTRLAARRRGRSIDFLINLKPPIETPDKHAVERYLDVLLPLGIKNASQELHLPVPQGLDREVEQMLRKAGLRAGELLIGLNPGAAYVPRRWAKERFAEAANLLINNFHAKCVVFAGPEERVLARELAALMPKESAIVLDKLSIPQLAAAIARCTIFITNDTGPMHIATAVGTPTLALMSRNIPWVFDPRGKQHRILRGDGIDAISVDEVYEVACEMLGKSRTSALFER